MDLEYYGKWIQHRRFMYEAFQARREPEYREEWQVHPKIEADTVGESLKEFHAYRSRLESLLRDRRTITVQGDRLPSSWTCVYCNNEMTREVEGHSAKDINDFVLWKVLRTCRRCGWWVYSYWRGENDGPGQNPTNVAVATEGVMARFSLTDDSAPISALRSHLTRNASLLSRISPKNLERVVASVFADYMKGCDVYHVGGPGDRGVDVLAIDQASKDKCLIQVKRRTRDNRAEGVQVVRELLGAMITESAPSGVVVSTAPRFSRQADDFARAVQSSTLIRRHLQVSLYDWEKIKEILSLTDASVLPPWCEVQDQVHYPEYR